ncbi:MAG: Acetoacetate metabolism regulatory protein AtoC [Pseudomonadota bacterium]|jgi:DNA-binding NtrC family response regulator
MGEVRKRVLIVDDEAGVRDSLKLLLNKDFEVDTAVDGEQALSRLDDFNPDVVLLDVLMPNLGGMDTLKQLRERRADTPVIMLTATNTVRTAVQAMKWGAIDYISKPFDIEELTGLLNATLGEDPKVGRGPQVARAGLTAPEADFGTMVGRSAAMSETFSRVAQIAPRDATVLITGESGTGKELVARRIHDLSSRKSGPFVPINCAAIPESLIESELFGHEKGAFTSAVERRVGHFELADGGTLFLDEIGELSLPVQVKMLRFLQEQEFYRVGRSKPIKVNVRIIAATNKNLEELIAQKLFRQDLFYRINVVSLNLPPLRDRFEDIPLLVEHFVRKFQPAYGGKALSLDAEALKTLIEYDWPGNVRELENVIESLMALSPNEAVTANDLPRKLKSVHHREVYKPGAGDDPMSFEDAERRFETEMILKALRKTNYVQTRAAELLGISRRILKYKMDKLGISDTPPAAAAPPPE